MADGLQCFGTVNLRGGAQEWAGEGPAGEVIAEKGRRPGFEFLEPTEKLDMGVDYLSSRDPTSEMGGGENF